MPSASDFMRVCRRTAGVWLSLCLGWSQALANPEAGEFPDETDSPAASVSAEAARLDALPMPPVAARYRVSVKPHEGKLQRLEWVLVRSPDSIAIGKGSIDEVWQRDASGIRLQRVFRAERSLVDYPSGELRALGLDLNWRVIGTLVDEEDLRLLKPVAPAPGNRARGAPVRLYVGKLRGERVQVEWDDQARLPVSLIREGLHGRVRFERLEVHASLPANWAVPGSRTEGFARYDAADFGDREWDRFVREAEAFDVRLGWRGAHGH